MTDRRPLLRAIFDAAVAAAHPEIVLSAHLRPAPKGRVICLAAGKGAAAMAAAAERHYLDALGLDPARLTGIATTRHGHAVPTRRIKVIEAGHPVPDEAGLKAADDTLRLAAEATADDLLLVLLSGGGSANWIAPVDGITLRAEAAGQSRAAALGRADRRDEHRPQASVADQGRPAGAARDSAPKSSRSRSPTCRMTILPRSRPGRRCRIRPRWPTPARWWPDTSSRWTTRSRAPSTMPGTRAASRVIPPLPARSSRSSQGRKPRWTPRSRSRRTRAMK